MTNERRQTERRGKAPAFQFYAKDWICDTARMTLEQEGAYVRLLAHQWIEGPLPSDTGELARRLGVGKRKFASIWRTLCAHFPAHSPETIANTRLEAEREKQAQFREKMVKAGSRSAERRRNVGSTNVEPESNKNVNVGATLLSPNSSKDVAKNPNWVRRLGAIWFKAYQGEAPFGMMGKLLKPLKDDPELESRFTAYVNQTPARFVQLSRFVETYGSWGKTKHDNYLTPADVA